MKRTRKPTPSASRLMGIISSVTGVDIMEATRRRPVVDARAIFYKIYKDMECWSYADIGALFGKDHATVIHGVKAIDSFMVYDKRIKMLYDRCKKLYYGEQTIDDYLNKTDLIEKVSQLDGRILDLNAYIAEMESEIKHFKEDPMSELYNMVRLHTPAAKIEDAKKKVRAVLNGL